MFAGNKELFLSLPSFTSHHFFYFSLPHSPSLLSVLSLFLSLYPSDNQRLAPPILRLLLKYISSPAYTSIDTGKTAKVNYGSTNEPEDPEGDTPVPTTQHPSKDSPIRWASLILYLTVTTPLIFAMIILAAVGSINT